MDLGLLTNKYFILSIVIWELIWKGLALWFAAKRDQKAIYVLLLVLNTVGLFPIGYLIYIKWFEKKKKRWLIF